MQLRVRPALPYMGIIFENNIEKHPPRSNQGVPVLQLAMPF
jgi:hypothetical protein